jgi:D-amino-acid dehydrogenase
MLLILLCRRLLKTSIMKIGIIGGGINGLFTAYYLQKQGCEVTIIERGDLSDSCSHGNAGMIVPSHIIPLAAPGMITKGLRWMLSPTSPFYIRPRLSGSLVKWGWLFYQNSTKQHVEKSIPVLRDISLLSKQLYQDFQREKYFDFNWHERGLMMLYQTAAMAHEETEGAATANKAGIEAEVLGAKAVQDLEPHTKVNAIGGVFYKGDAHVSPHLLISGLKNLLNTEGVKFLYKTEVQNFEIQNEKVTAVITQTERVVFDEIVIAVGAWSGILSEKLGISLPLQGGKGYSMQFEGLGTKVNIPAIMLEARATATPMGNTLRCAGTMEIAGIDLSVNMNRVKGIIQGVNRFYPELKVTLPQPEQVWRGLRPCSPDGLPYIGRVGHLKNVTMATGHGMMGLSLGAATGKLVSEVVLRHPLSMGIDFLSPMRFD